MSERSSGSSPSSFYRSEPMAYCEVFLQAFACIAELGEIGVSQFADLNGPLSICQRKFAKRIRELDQVLRQLKEIGEEFRQCNISVNTKVGKVATPLPQALIEIEESITNVVKQIQFINQSSIETKVQIFEMRQLSFILEMAKDYLHDESSQNWENISPESLNEGRDKNRSKFDQEPSTLSYICGMVSRKRIASLETMLWRITRGHCYFRHSAILETLNDPYDGVKRELNAFIAIFQGQELKKKIVQVLEGYHAKIFRCPASGAERNKLMKEINDQLADCLSIIDHIHEQKMIVLKNVATDHRRWHIQIEKAKRVYKVLNLFNTDVTRRYLIGEFWCPSKSFAVIDQALKDAYSRIHGDGFYGVPFVLHRLEISDMKPPTYFELNEFTSPFQSIVNAYGVPRFQEINPAFFATVFFPFYFAVMFGDIGHGLVLFVFAAFLFFRQSQFKETAHKHELFNIIFHGRFLLLLMAIGSIYAGVIYNDIFSKATDSIGTSWRTNFTFDELRESEVFQLNPVANFSTWPYPIGLDPVWQAAQNKIVFVNSVKMKFSVIIGFSHMLFGVFLSLLNHIYFKNYANIYCEFFPKILFIVAIFGYMVALIIFKWIKFDGNQCGEAPNILFIMISMVFFNYTIDSDADRWVAKHLRDLQNALMIVAILSIPWLLFAKPIYQYRKQKNYHRKLREEQLLEDLHRVATVGVFDNPNFREEVHIVNLNEVEPEVAQQIHSMASPESVANLEDLQIPPHAFELPHSISTSSFTNGGRGFAVVYSTVETIPEHQLIYNRLANRGVAQRPRSGSTGSSIGPIPPIRHAHHRQSFASTAYYTEEWSSVAGSMPHRDRDFDEYTEGTSITYDSDDDAFNYAELFFNQAINTVEYVLGLVSHTASYLRLWALSLAHAELGDLLWLMILSKGFALATNSIWGSLAIVTAFALWAFLTSAILCCMETLSAFLHALRLQWVEFQSKFYHGDGWLFEPFSFRNINIEIDLIR